MESELEYIFNQELLICKTSGAVYKYRVFQVYGQKFVKIMDSCRIPEETSEIYVTNIPRNMEAEEIFRFFMKCGDIYQLRLLMDFSGYNRGKCFVQFFSERSCREAICCLNGEPIGGNSHHVDIKISLNNNQLLLKNVPVWITEEYMSNYIRSFIGEGLSNVSMKPSTIPFKNFCLCIYKDHQFAMMALKKAWPFLKIDGSYVDVQWAVPDLLKNVAYIYFTNYPPDMTKYEFFNILADTLDIGTVVQFRFNVLNGYITFRSTQALTDSLVTLEHLTVRGQTLKFSRVPYNPDIYCDIDGPTAQYFDSRYYQYGSNYCRYGSNSYYWWPCNTTYTPSLRSPYYTVPYISPYTAPYTTSYSAPYTTSYTAPYTTSYTSPNTSYPLATGTYPLTMRAGYQSYSLFSTFTTPPPQARVSTNATTEVDVKTEK